MKNSLLKLAACVALIGAIPLASVAADDAAYTPDIAELAPGNEMAFPPDQDFYLENKGTIEFWLAADWKTAPDYDPVAISNVGSDGASYMIAVLRDRDGLGLLSGDLEETIPFDFSDGAFHHVAVTSGDGVVLAYIDGEVCGAYEMSLTDLPSSGFFIGSSDGTHDPFAGAIAGLRIWSAPLEVDDLVSYARKDIFAQGDEHPAIENLVALSVFDSRELLVVNSITEETPSEGEAQ